MKNINNNLLEENSLTPITEYVKLNPYFVTGLTNAEGYFSIQKHKDSRAKHKVSIGLRFKLTMLVNEINLLHNLKSFFNCGLIAVNKDGSVD